MFRYIRFFLFLLSSCAILVACSGSRIPEAASAPIATPPSATMAPPFSKVVWPTHEWRTSSPEEQGMDSQKLDQMLVSIDQEDLDLDSLLVIRHGTIVSETYYPSYQADTLHELYSVTKSVIATLVGIAIDKGLIDGTGHPILEYFPGYQFDNLDDRKRAMSLEHVLTMTTGLDWVDNDPAFMALYRSDDWVSYMLGLPMVEQPGAQFNYCSGCSHLLSAVVQHTAGMNTREFAERNLFKPLGITDFDWETDSSGIPIGGWGLQLTPREMAKLGYLYLHAGEWEGEQIVSSEWIAQATRQHTETDGDLGYGYQWWIYPKYGAYTALGRYGQTIFVVPESDLIVVTTAGSLENHDAIFRLIEEHILPAIQVPEGGS